MESSNKTWFHNKPYFLTAVGFLLTYSLIASEWPILLKNINYILSPIVNSLSFIGLGIRKPFIDGPMPSLYYINLTGIGIWSVVIYNIRSVFWYLSNGVKKNKAASINSIRNGSKKASAFALLAAFFFVALVIAVFLFGFLNGLNGWLVFHVSDFLVPVLLIVMCIFPSSLIIPVLWPISYAIIQGTINIYNVN